MSTPCIDGPGERTRLGYVRVWRGGKRFLAHRLAYEDRHGPIAPGIELDHLCRNRWCRNPDHMDPVPHVVNSRRSSKSKLTPDSVRAIRRRFAAGGITKTALAREYGVTKQSIGHIIARRQWAEL